MLARYQNGCLTTITRQDGVERWLFRWRERGPHGCRERNKIIGPVKDYPEKSKKLQEAVARLRQNINTDGPTELTSVTMAKVVDHYIVHELADSGDQGKAYSTRNRKKLLLYRWVLPHWGKRELRDIKTVAVEQWLKRLTTEKFGEPKPLAGGTKEKIRDAMSSIFNHAIRWEFTDKIPLLVRSKGQECEYQQNVNVNQKFSKSERCASFLHRFALGSGRWSRSTCPRACAGASWRD